MRRRCGVVQGDILDVINSRSKEEQDKAYAIIAEIEEQALKQMKLMPGALELLQHTSSVPRGLITRNVMSSVHHFHNHHLIPAGVPPFIPAISRECNYEYKPSPQALLHICNSWGASPSEVIMVGDSAKDDIVCGNRAGALTVLLDYNGMHNYEEQDLQGELRPTFLVRSLPELQDLLRKEFQLVPPPNPHAAIEERGAR
ncbi:HAD-like domain-containing protein [Dunaliella salina]|uniref:HAD-like domain-containing protein n=1 Tax=Dunaliella salina TaxID=3046 RepID=A0ABQ7GJQ4_DUNSA|nr:HAD-like domain-containing protein [Dunaliella salina]|eukprot:KAF5834840.1 HAD-like domain-containing protein [Dunaliella salina]